jgi:hypothetical protein
MKNLTYISRKAPLRARRSQPVLPHLQLDCDERRPSMRANSLSLWDLIVDGIVAVTHSRPSYGIWSGARINVGEVE